MLIYTTCVEYTLCWIHHNVLDTQCVIDACVLSTQHALLMYAPCVLETQHWMQFVGNYILFLNTDTWVSVTMGYPLFVGYHSSAENHVG